MKNEKVMNNFKGLEGHCPRGKSIDFPEALSLICSFLHYLCGSVTEVILRLPEPKEKKAKKKKK